MKKAPTRKTAKKKAAEITEKVIEPQQQEPSENINSAIDPYSAGINHVLNHHPLFAYPKEIKQLKEDIYNKEFDIKLQRLQLEANEKTVEYLKGQLLLKEQQLSGAAREAGININSYGL